MKNLRNTRQLVHRLSRFFSDNEDNKEGGKANHIFISHDTTVEKAKRSLNINLFDSFPLFTDEYFEKKGNHMNIENKSLSIRNDANMITEIGDGIIGVNNAIYNVPVILTKNMMYVWEVDKFENLKKEDFMLLEHLLPEYEYAVISTGDEHKELNNEIAQYLESLGKNFNAVDSFLAGSTFNNCMENDIEVVGFFIL